jgi:hypothetical protein
MAQRRRAQDLEDRMFEIERDARAGLRGLRGTSRIGGGYEVTVIFTDEGWEATKRLLALGAPDS